MRLSPRRSTSMAASSLPLLLFLAAAARAQDTTTTDDSGDTTTQQQNTSTNTKTQQQTTQTAAQTVTKQTNTAKGTTAAGTTAAGTKATITNLPTLGTGTDTVTASSTAVPTTDITDAPSLSSSSVFHLSDVPTIAGYGIPTAIVPWTAGAPYMQRSNLPEGTVFIVVGALLGFMGAAILAWRGMVAWSLHRSVKRASANALTADSMAKLSKPAPGYTGGLNGSTHSLDRLSTAPTGRLTKSSHGLPPSANSAATRNSSLFFSPTAGAGHHSSPAAALLNPANNRSSAYLPAGYYGAPGAASPASGAPTTTLGGSSPLSALNPLHPSRAGYRPQRDFGPSPPASPSPPPSRPSAEQPRRGTGGYAGGYERMSGYGGQMGNAGLYSQPGSTLSNLHVPGGNINGGRAPSANLEELFENHGNGPRERF